MKDRLNRLEINLDKIIFCVLSAVSLGGSIGSIFYRIQANKTAGAITEAIPKCKPLPLGECLAELSERMAYYENSASTLLAFGLVSTAFLVFNRYLKSA